MDISSLWQALSYSEPKFAFLGADFCPPSMSYVFNLFVCLFVSRIAQKNYSTDCYKIRWKGRTWAKEETVIYLS